MDTFEYAVDAVEQISSALSHPVDSIWSEVTTEGKGNCFYRAVLLAVGGGEDEFMEVRMTLA